MLDQDAPDAGKDKIFRAGKPESAAVVADLSAVGGSYAAGSAFGAGCMNGGDPACGASGASCGAVAVKVPFVH